MNFQHTWRQVLDGSKTQTRRLVKSEHIKAGALNVLIPYVYTRPDYGGGFMGHRKLWQVGRTYAVQPGRGQKAVGRIRITDIRQECVQDISEDDAWKEIGYLDNNPWHDDFCHETHPDIVAEWGCYVYSWLWKRIHTTPGTRWSDNPEVWVLTFELVEARS